MPTKIPKEWVQIVKACVIERDHILDELIADLALNSVIIQASDFTQVIEILDDNATLQITLLAPEPYRDEVRAICLIPSGQWQRKPGTGNVS
jgi:hypothetical protein